eukprot:EG_transcript_53295
MQFMQQTTQSGEKLPVPLTETAAQSSKLPVLSAQDGKTLQKIQLTDGSKVPKAATLVKWNPKSVHQWHSDDILRVDMTKHPEWVRTMRMFHGTVWRHRPEFRHPWFSRGSRASGIIMLVF